MQENITDRSFLAIIVIILFSFIVTLLMGQLHAFEKLVLFLEMNKFLNFANFAVFFPSFLAMGFVLFALNKIDQLKIELKNINVLQSKLMESDEKHRRLSITDDLTNLHNSRHFYQQLQTEIDRVARYGEPLSLAIMDIDNFKRHNDTYGHLEGDNVLSSLGKLINDHLRCVDSGYRYGGEEFAVVLPNTDLKGAAMVAERIRSAFEAVLFLPVPAKEVHCTVSVGVAQYESGLALKAFVDKADKAMYLAKEQGKNRVALL